MGRSVALPCQLAQRRSARSGLPEDALTGDTIPDGAPGTAECVVVTADEPHVLVLRSTTHIPPGWDDTYGARIVWTWCFTVTPRDGGTRLHLRVRGHMEPLWFAALYVATIVPADFVMARGMLRGLKARAGGRDP
jgi:hypothetical protein